METAEDQLMGSLIGKESCIVVILVTAAGVLVPEPFRIFGMRWLAVLHRVDFASFVPELGH